MTLDLTQSLYVQLEIQPFQQVLNKTALSPFSLRFNNNFGELLMTINYEKCILCENCSFLYFTSAKIHSEFQFFFTSNILG